MSHAVPEVHCEQHHPVLAVRDVEQAVQFYTTRLGFEQGFLWGDPPLAAGVNLGQVSIHLVPGDPQPGCSVYFVIDDADALYAFHQAQGIEIAKPIANRPWGLRDYTVRDQDGYELVFGHRLPVTEPALEIERVDVPLRLEKRLAALLHDLAEHKQMSLSGCIEEALLHTLEPTRDGVASPHTKRTLAYIEKLKQQHGIDYDAHACYQFVEK